MFLLECGNSPPGHSTFTSHRWLLGSRYTRGKELLCVPGTLHQAGNPQAQEALTFLTSAVTISLSHVKPRRKKTPSSMGLLCGYLHSVTQEITLCLRDFSVRVQPLSPRGRSSLWSCQGTRVSLGHRPILGARHHELCVSHNFWATGMGINGNSALTCLSAWGLHKHTGQNPDLQDQVGNKDVISDCQQSLMSGAGKQNKTSNEVSQGYRNKTHATVLDTAPGTRKKHPPTGMITLLFSCSYPLPGIYCLIFVSS